MKELTFSDHGQFFTTENNKKGRVSLRNAVRHRELKVLGFTLILMSLVGLFISGLVNFDFIKSPFFENHWFVVSFVPLILGISIFSNLKVLDESL